MYVSVHAMLNQFIHDIYRHADIIEMSSPINVNEFFPESYMCSEQNNSWI